MSRHRLRHLVRLFRVLEGLPRTLVSRRVFLLPLSFAGAMGVGGEVVQFSGPLMVFVMRSVVISSRHIEWTFRVGFSAGLQLKRFDLPGFGVGFLGKLIGANRNTQGRAPHASYRSRCRLFRCARQRCDGRERQARAVPRLSCESRAWWCTLLHEDRLGRGPHDSGTATTGGEAIEYRVRA